ncbi:MAG: hypothetical protein ACTHK2_08315 [Dokdonella sp.]|uniref:hypothetical protein n=1 Tax=Dokdonella sp. TaxID=2291710 RepID=UPI003F7E29E7
MIDLPANPWRDLPHTPPYVLAVDRRAVDVFNSDAPDPVRLRVETCPEPFFGPLDAPIVVLLLNPGVSDDDRYDDGLHAIVRGDEVSDGHFYLTGKNDWWSKLVRALSRERPDVDVSRRVLSVEFIAYRSKSFGCGHLRLASQDYSFALVRDAIGRKAAIVIVRGARYWFGAVPELHGYENLIGIVNPQSASLSRRNLKADGFDRLIAALDR